MFIKTFVNFFENLTLPWKLLCNELNQTTNKLKICKKKMVLKAEIIDEAGLSPIFVLNPLVLVLLGTGNKLK